MQAVFLTENSGVVLEKVCEYLYFNQKYADSKDVPDMEIPPELCLELLIAADYLDGRSLNCRLGMMLTCEQLEVVMWCAENTRRLCVVE